MRLLLILIMSALILITSVSATQYVCYNLKEGQLGCNHQLCINCYDDNLKLVSPHFCQNINCIPFVETETQTELTISSPQDNSIQSSRLAFLSLKSSKAVSLSYGLSDTARLIVLAKNISTYNKKINLKEGQNNITIKITDSTGSLTKQLKVLVDTKKPLINTYTRLSKVNGTFIIKFSEDNLKAVRFYYENKSEEVNICNKSKAYWLCSFFVDLTSYNNKSITYYFRVEDIAGNNATTSKIKAKVYSPPTFDKVLAFQIQTEELEGGNDE